MEMIKYKIDNLEKVYSTCINCLTMVPETRHRVINLPKKEYKYRRYYFHCPKCGQEFFVPEPLNKEVWVWYGTDDNGDEQVCLI